MKAKKIIFLDRDGVINRNPEYKDYVKKPHEFRLLPGVAKAMKMLKKSGFELVVISNQCGIGKGLFTKKDLKEITHKMIRQLKTKGAFVDKVFYCVHHPEANCECRKPGIGMLKKAVKGSKVDKKHSFFVGDTERDAVTGKKFGINTVAVLSGYADRKSIRKWQVAPDFIAKDLLAAARVILKHSV